MYVWRRIYHPPPGEYRCGEYVSYVTTRTMSGGDEGMYTNSEPPKVVAKPRLRLVADLREFRAWRRYQRAYGQAQTYDHGGLDG
jgi:hypothetical protein